MKRKHILTVILLTCFIIAVSIFLVPAFDRIFFHPREAAAEQESIGTALKSESKAFMEAFWFPMLEKREHPPGWNPEYFIADSQAISSGLYRDLFADAGVSLEEAAENSLEMVKEGSYYVLEKTVEKDGKCFLLQAAANSDTVPVLFCFRNAAKPAEDEVREAETCLKEYAAQAAPELSDYVSWIEEIYGGFAGYRGMTTDIYSEISESAGVELLKAPTLWECTDLGEWQVFADGNQVILVSLMGRYSLILYYDASEKRFCGFNLAVNESLFQ